MEEIKQRIISIIDKVNKSFPDDQDLKGFPGISKTLITDSLIQSDALLVTLGTHPDSFDIIILKRELAEQFEKIDDVLSESFKEIGDKKFNSLLKTLSRVRLLIRDTYFSLVNEQPIRTEAQLAKASEEIKELSKDITYIKDSSKEIHALKEVISNSMRESQAQILNDAGLSGTEIKRLKEEVTVSRTEFDTEVEEFTEKFNSTQTSATEILGNLTSKVQSITESETKINVFLEEIEENASEVKTVSESVAQWKLDIQSIKVDIEKLSKEYAELNTKSRTIQSEIDSNYNRVVGVKDSEGKITKRGLVQEMEDQKIQIVKFLEDQRKRYHSQFSEIEGLLPGATSAGLAEAYQKQKDSYKRPILLWSIVFIATTATMAGLSILLIYEQFVKETELTLNGAFISFLKDLPFFIPTIWLAAYASKQQSQYKRLMQEYAFKEANAKSFHGHKKQIEELMKNGAADKQLLNDLVAQLVVITSQNPSMTLDSKSHDDSPPLLKAIQDSLRFRKPKDMKLATTENGKDVH